ncbi:MAG: TorF family putative porin [Sideroxyarcus sp.]|nr:TorF family putative porin [Sideroxyarcus sp.]
MLKNKLLVAALATAFAMPAAAESTVSSNVGFVSDYIYRGITQTSHNPAVQGGMDFTHDSGLYVGAWGSNVSWIADSGAVASGSVTMELDTYLGYRSTISDVGYDVGFVRYNYLGDYTATDGFAKADTQEIYGSVSYKFLSAKYSYSLGDFLTVVDGKGSSYLELNASYAIEGTGVTLTAHAGKQTFKPSAADTLYSYTDYKLGVSKDLSGYVVGVAYTSTNAGPAWTYADTVGGEWGKGVVAVSVTHAM